MHTECRSHDPHDTRQPFHKMVMHNVMGETLMQMRKYIQVKLTELL